MKQGNDLFKWSIFIASVLFGVVFFTIHNHVIDFSALLSVNSKKYSVLLDDEGNEWERFQFDKRNPIEEENIPQHLINAFIAAEDWHFFDHNGISWRGIIRSIIVNVYYGRKAQGASTITQQLVKLLFFDAQKTFSRKLKEQFYALLVEQQCTKQQILYTYLNNVCFGCGIYGIEAASQRFWNKHAHELSIGESATLAGIICAPAHYCPLAYPLSAEKRRNVILGKMKHLGFISEQEYNTIVASSLIITEKISNPVAPYLKEMIRNQLENEFGKTALYTQGFYIKTTVNQKMQRAAQIAFEKEIKSLRAEFKADIDGGMIVLDRKTGDIKALVGGFDFSSSKFNRVTQARRQIGSVFKPLIYAEAVNSGQLCSDTEVDEPFELEQYNGVWAPNNYNKKFNGAITLAYALSHSNNIVSIKTFLKLDAYKVISLAKECGLSGPFHTYPSLALGCIDGTLYEVAGMFNIFANDGIFVEPHLISWVKNCWGSRVYTSYSKIKRILSSAVVGQVASVLSLGLQRVRGLFGRNNWINSQAISKTGTTNDSRTCWFVGSTPSLTVAVYVGFDDNRPMGNNIYPIKTAFPIWLAFNKAIQSEEKIFSYDSSLASVTIHEKTGELCPANSPGAVSILIPHNIKQYGGV